MKGATAVVSLAPQPISSRLNRQVSAHPIELIYFVAKEAYSGMGFCSLFSGSVSL